MKNTLELLGQTFRSSTGKTEQYIVFYGTFKREFTKLLKDIGCKEIKFSKPNHFDVSGFFKLDDQCFYFRLEDLRWYKDSLLVRTAKSYTDYTGGHNKYVNFDDNFAENIENIISGVEKT